MKYKILKGTKLFDQFIELKKKMVTAKKAAKELVKEVAPVDTEWYAPHESIAGGVDAFIIPGGKPDGWVNAYIPHEKDVYRPKKTLANKELLDKIANLPVVSTSDFNSIIKYDWRKTGAKKQLGRRITSYSPGFDIRANYVLIDVSEHAPNYKPVPDMIEITVSEYNKLSK